MLQTTLPSSDNDLSTSVQQKNHLKCNSEGSNAQKSGSYVRRLLDNSIPGFEKPGIQGVTPIHELPVEILRYIFELCPYRISQLKGFHSHIYQIATNRAPFNFIQVCKLWRLVALDTSSLWNAIMPSRSSVAVMQGWLDLAPEFPLHLEFCNSSPTDTRYNAAHSQEIFRLFAREAHRWRSLSMDLDATLAPELLTLMRSTVDNPLLIKDLTVEVPIPDGFLPVIDGILSLLPTLPSLECLKWSDFSKAITLENVPWSRLKIVLVEHPSSAAQFANYLSQCTSATTISFTPADKHGGLHSPHFSMPIVSLPHLTSLTLSRSCDPIRTLQYFDFPSLRTLRVAVQKRDHVELERLLARTICLEFLSIDECGREKHFPHDQSLVSDQDVVNYLTNPYIRRLPHFEITFKEAYSRGIEIIRAYPNLANVLPHLLCWWGKWHWSCIGWGNDLDVNAQLLWRYKGGNLELTTLYENQRAKT